MEDSFTVSRPFLWGEGPATFSTAVSIVPRYPMIWDVNGYYRQLGVSVYATRAELRKAYRRKKGWRSPRLTYILKQLLNPDIRQAYDSTPMGEVFWDRYVEDYVRRQAHAEASKMRREGKYEEAEDLGDYASPFSDLNEEDGNLEPVRSSRYIEDSWPWSYYLWQTQCADTDRLRRWQEALVEALGGEHYEVALGFVGGVGLPWRVERVGYRLVAFLGDWARPSKDLAEQAAQQIEEQARRDR